ncbi:MAG: TRAP transporter small permease [Rhizobiales bacterium]|nr:TRAP transporter small permease [Hyphomicrobiales bacterium]
MEAAPALPPDGLDRFATIRAFRKILHAADWLAERVIIVIMAVMLAIVTSQVGMRYLLNRSLDWADETATLCFVWTVFLSLPLALRNGGHIVMEMLLTAVSPKVRDVLYRCMSVLSLGMMVLISREAFVLTRDNWDETIPVLNLSGGLFYLAVAIGAAHCTLRTVEICLSGEPKKSNIIE